MDRLKELDEIVQSAAIDVVLCLDDDLAKTPFPEELRGPRFGFLSQRVLEADLRSVLRSDAVELRVALHMAEKHGSSGFSIPSAPWGPQGTAVPTALRVADLRPEVPVRLIMAGDFGERWEPERDVAFAPGLTRMLVHKVSGTAHYLTMDPKTPEVMGWSVADLHGTGAADLLHPDDVEVATASWARMLTDASTSRHRARVKTKDGRYLWIDATIVNNLHDRFDPHVRMEAIDVGHVVEARAAVIAIESQFEALAMTLPVGVVQTNASGGVIFANTWVLERTGMVASASEPVRWGDAFHPEERDHAAEQLTGALRGVEVEFDARMGNPSLEVYRLCRIRARPLESHGVRTGMICSIEDVTDSESLKDKLRTEATTDFLTGLPNRSALVAEINRLRLGSVDLAHATDRSACLFIDVDGFKLVNDALGHDAGDRVLSSVAERLRSAVRGDDMVARVGGDEFVVVCPDAGADDVVLRLAERLVNAVAEQGIVGDVPAMVGASIGIAFFEGGARTADQILGDADVAMYRAKRAGGSRWEVFDSRMRSEIEERFELKRSLVEAYKRNEFRIHLQAVHDMITGEVVGAEALLRWEHPTRGLIAPRYFLDVLAEMELMIAVGWWTINELCRIGTRLVGNAGPLFRLAVNANGDQVLEENFCNKFLDVVASHGLKPDNMTLELTETVLVNNGGEVFRTLEQLRNAGVAIALDDFGTGYSSLNHVRDMPVSVLKIDMSYVQGMRESSTTQALVEVIQILARKLGLGVIAEGIETKDQQATLVAMGIRHGQGFLLSRPCDEETFLDRYAPRRGAVREQR